jgi:hypothetical protein
MAIRMQQRTGTYLQWNTSNPVLNGAEIGYESDTNKFKIGDGSTNWNDLPYFLDEVTLETSLDGYIPSSLLGANNGVAQLNSSGKLVSDQIPNVDEITQDAINTALVAGTGLDKTYNDNANTITIDIDSTVATKTYVDDAIDSFEALPAQTGNTGKFLTTDGSATSWATVDLSSKQDKVTGVSDTEIGYLDGVTSAIQTQLNDKAASSDIAELAQDAVGNAVGTGLSYNDSTGAISVTTNTYDAYGSASAVAGDLSTHTSDTTTHGVSGDIVGTSDTQTLTNKTLTSPVINGATVGGDLVPSTDATYDLGSSTNKFKDLYLSGTTLYLDQATIGLHSGNIQLSHSGNTTTVPIGGGAHTVATESYVDTAVSNLIDGAGPALDTLNELAAAINDDDSYAATITTALGNKQDKVTGVSDTEIGYLDGVTSAIQTQINNKAPLESPTFTGTVDFSGATVTGLPAPEFVQMTTVSVSSNITLESNKRYFVDTAAARTLTLPANPANGDDVQVFDVTGSAATNNIVVDSNSLKINGTVQNLEIDIDYDIVSLVYTGSTYGWVVI